MSNWGYKLHFSVYIPGDADNHDDVDEISKAAQDLNMRFPDNHFIGVKKVLVENDPEDQIAT